MHLSHIANIVYPKINLNMRNFLGKNSFCLNEGQVRAANLYTKESGFLYFTASFHKQFDPNTNIWMRQTLNLPRCKLWKLWKMDKRSESQEPQLSLIVHLSHEGNIIDFVSTVYGLWPRIFTWRETR